MMADATQAGSNQIVLACTIPDRAEPGQVFHVRAPDGRYFEVTVPDGAAPNETLNIVVPAPPSSDTSTASPTPVANLIAGGGAGSSEEKVPLASVSPEGANPPSSSQEVTVGGSDGRGGEKSIFSSLSKLGTTMGSKINELDNRYGISETALAQAQKVDDKFKISEKTKTFGAVATAHAKALDEKYEIQQKIASLPATIQSTVRSIDEKHKVSERVGIIVKEIDARLAISPTVAILVTNGR